MGVQAKDTQPGQGRGMEPQESGFPGGGDVYKLNLKRWVGVYAEKIWGSCSRQRTAWLKSWGCEKSRSVVGTISCLLLLKKGSVGLCVAGKPTGELAHTAQWRCSKDLGLHPAGVESQCRVSNTGQVFLLAESLW